MEDWQDDWYWHDSENCASEWYDNENAYLVCGVAGSNPTLKIDSGSQSTACIQERSRGTFRIRKIEAHGKKIVDVTFHGQANETPVPTSIKVDVSDVARNVASMGRLLRARFDLHFTNHGHTCWMENGGLKTTISEDSPTSEALLYSLDVEMLPPPGELCESSKSSTTMRFRVCKWISSSSLVLLCGVPRHRPRQLR